ncbi:MAG: hypothetical protein IMY77_05000 [Chloroflexi bacterium]|nr:hypothetical protein [Chloroflexota bacterium]
MPQRLLLMWLSIGLICGFSRKHVWGINISDRTARVATLDELSMIIPGISQGTE